MSPSLILMCGPAGSGKTHVARQLEAAGYQRLSIDEEAWRRGIRQAVRPYALTAEIEADLKLELVRLLQQGRDVVVDNACHSREMRDAYRALADPLGVQAVVYYVETPRDVVLARIAERTGDGPNDANLPPEVAAGYYAGLERPVPGEEPYLIIDGTTPDGPPIPR